MIRYIVGAGEVLAFLTIACACVWGFIALAKGVNWLRRFRQ